MHTINQDGELYFRGEPANHFCKGDQVSILHEIDDSLIKVIFLTGPSKGLTAFIEKHLIERN